jgi:hypothetical protein
MTRPAFRSTVVVLGTLLSSCDVPGPGGTASSATATSTSAGSASATRAEAPSPSASASASPAPYAGPKGTLRGLIRIKGDPPPATPHAYPKGCEGTASATYGTLFRVGQGGALADALVSVTRYEGFVPPARAVVPVTVSRCAYSTRTIAMTEGQHLEVRNVDVDTTSYVPWLDGAKLPASIVAVPQGDPVKLYSRGFGRYWLRDQMGRTFMVAHVFHLRYATTSVTGLDGQYRIEGIPVGKVDVSAMLPQANMLSVTQPFEIKEGDDNVLDLELTFDAKKDVPPVSEDTLSESGNKPGPSASPN